MDEAYAAIWDVDGTLVDTAELHFQAWKKVAAELGRLFSRDGFVQGVGSSAPRANLDLILELTGTVKYFRAIVSSEDTQQGKPDPQVFLTAAERLGVAPGRC